jgi:hypothetical protein
MQTRSGPADNSRRVCAKRSFCGPGDTACLCGQQCGLDIELDHIDPSFETPALNDTDNAIPVCYLCHAKLEFSRAGSPRGSKFSIAEIKARRDQIGSFRQACVQPPYAIGILFSSTYESRLNDTELCEKATLAAPISRRINTQV